MNEELAILLLVAKRLDESHFAYMVTGSVAMNFYASPRMTRDIDIVAEIKEQDATKLVQLFGNDFYIDQEMIVSAVKHEGMFNIIHTETVIKVDFVIRKDSPFGEKEFNQRKQIQINDSPIWIVSPEDLVISKIWWAKSGSEQQLKDVTNLLNQVKGIDKSYIEEWVKKLDLSEVYNKVLP